MQRSAAVLTALGLSLSLALGAVAASAGTVAHPSALNGAVMITPQGHVELDGVVGSIDLAGKKMTVHAWGIAWTVIVNDAVVVPNDGNDRRTLGDLRAGHMVHVVGTANTATPLTILARRIVDQSLPISEITRIGMITGIAATNNTFTLQVHRGGQITVKAAADTKVFAGDTAKSFADLSVGMMVYVRGMYDVQTNTLSASEIRIRPIDVCPTNQDVGSWWKAFTS